MKIYLCVHIIIHKNLEAECNKTFAAYKTSTITWIWNAGNFSNQSKIFRRCLYGKVKNRKNIPMMVKERRKVFE